MRLNLRSPLSGRPSRHRRQSMDEQRLGLAYDNFLAPHMMALFLVVMAGLEWWRYYFPQNPTPILYSIIAVLGGGYAAYELWRVWPDLKILRSGSDGKKVVEQYLDRLREEGYQVFHDVVGTGYNMDHVLIGPAGLFCIETRTFDKHQGPDVRVAFDGEHILVDGLAPDRDPTVQARAQSAWISQLLTAGTGRIFPTRPVILFPGCYVESSKDSARDLWVLNPRALSEFIAHEPEVLTAADVRLASSHLARLARGPAPVEEGAEKGLRTE